MQIIKYFFPYVHLVENSVGNMPWLFEWHFVTSMLFLALLLLFFISNKCLVHYSPSDSQNVHLLSNFRANTVYTVAWITIIQLHLRELVFTQTLWGFAVEFIWLLVISLKGCSFSRSLALIQQGKRNNDPFYTNPWNHI